MTVMRVLLALAALLGLGLSGAEARLLKRLARSSAKASQKGIFSVYTTDYGQVQQCDCSCCIAQQRLPNEVSIQYMLVPPAAHGPPPRIW